MHQQSSRSQPSVLCFLVIDRSVCTCIAILRWLRACLLISTARLLPEIVPRYFMCDRGRQKELDEPRHREDETKANSTCWRLGDQLPWPNAMNRRCSTRWTPRPDAMNCCHGGRTTFYCC